VGSVYSGWLASDCDAAAAAAGAKACSGVNLAYVLLELPA